MEIQSIRHILDSYIASLLLKDIFFNLIRINVSLFKENDFVEYDSTGNSIDLTKSTSTISSIYTKDGYDIGRKIAWKAWYLIPENLVSATIYYGGRKNKVV